MSNSNTRFVINLNPSNSINPVWLKSFRPSDWNGSAHGPVVVATNDRSEAVHFLDFYDARNLLHSTIGWPESRVEEIGIAPPTTPAEVEAECCAQEDSELVARRMVSVRPAVETAEQQAARLHHAEECLFAIELANKPLRAALARFGVLAEASIDANKSASRLYNKWLKTGDKRAELRRAEIIAETMKDAAATALTEVRRLEALQV